MPSGRRAASINIEHAVSALIGAAGVAVLVGAGNIRIPLTSNVVDPRFFPRIVGGLRCVVAVLHAVTVARGNLGEPDEGEDVDLSLPTDYRSLFAVAASFIAHTLLVDRVVGYPQPLFSLPDPHLGSGLANQYVYLSWRSLLQR